MRTLTQDQAAALIGVTARRLRQMDREEFPPPKDGSGQYPPEAFGTWIKARVQRMTAIDGTGEILDLNAERARHSKQQADRLEMENAVRRGELMDTGVVAAAWEKIAMSAKTKLLAVPSKAAPLLAGKTIAEIKDILESHVHECAAAIAGDPMGEGMEAAAAPDGESMGRQKPEAEPGKRRRPGRVEH